MRNRSSLEVNSAMFRKGIKMEVVKFMPVLQEYYSSEELFRHGCYVVSDWISTWGQFYRLYSADGIELGWVQSCGSSGYTCKKVWGVK